jgi:broad specificity phosphatase PhoE
MRWMSARARRVPAVVDAGSSKPGPERCHVDVARRERERERCLPRDQKRADRPSVGSPCAGAMRCACWQSLRRAGRVGPMRRILLARHGETSWNALARLQGDTDIPLNDVGRGQARALAGRIAGAGVTAVWTSQLVRARETGVIIAAALGLAAPAIDRELRERSYGVFEGLTREECATRYPDAWRDWVAQIGAPPGAEGRDEAAARLRGALGRIAASDGGPVLVISHGGAMRLWLMTLLGPSVPVVTNAMTYVVEHAPDRVQVTPLAG